MKRLQTTYSKFIFHGPVTYQPHPSISSEVYRIITTSGETINLLPSEAVNLAKDILATFKQPANTPIPKE